ncbi:unnamed protein product [Oikopleura dioica]|uniref:J domain-containing protein n=1 Tax=Oikopleura dioica TaxID=34765 RepID=E4Y828_OIKDI|nr:unnamed protein product [Oikopleura dioica]
MTYYDTLGVRKTASEQDIKRAYRRLALECHPDKNKGSLSSERKFKEISEAYQVLSDEAKRREYDEEIRSAPGKRVNFSSPDSVPSFRARRNPNHRFTMLDPMDLFKNFFGDDFGATFFKRDPFFSHDLRASSKRNDPFDDPFFRDPFMSSFRQAESQLQGVNWPTMGSSNITGGLENPQFHSDAPVKRSGGALRSVGGGFSSSLFDDDFFESIKGQTTSGDKGARGGHFQSYSYSYSNVNGDEKEVKAKNINGKKSYQAKHNGKVIDERFDDLDRAGTSSIDGRSRRNTLK